MLAALIAAALVGTSRLDQASQAAERTAAPAALTFELPLDAHDGDLFTDADGRVYFAGTAYGCGFRLNVPSAYCGVRVYRTDSPLDGRWEAVGAVAGLAFDPRTDGWQDRCGYPRFGCFRPHVVRRPDGRYVMWINTHTGSGSAVAAGYRVLLADAPEGPYIDSGVTPRLAQDPADGGLEHGDMDLTVDAATQRAYLVYTVISRAGNGHRLVVEELDPTWTTGTGRHREVRSAGDFVEAPSLFRSPGNGWWFVAYSNPAVPYGVAATAVVGSRTPLGEYDTPRMIQADSCRGQLMGITEVAPGEVVYASDRWLQPASGDNTAIIANQSAALPYFGRLSVDPWPEYHACRATR